MTKQKQQLINKKKLKNNNKQKDHKNYTNFFDL